MKTLISMIFGFSLFLFSTPAQARMITPNHATSPARTVASSPAKAPVVSHHQVKMGPRGLKISGGLVKN